MVSMRSGGSRIRARVAALLLAMAALWAFATWSAARDAADLGYAAPVQVGTGEPVAALIDALAQERRAASGYLGEHGTPDGRALAATRTRTDATRSHLRWAVPGRPGGSALGAALRDAGTGLDRLAPLRNRIDRHEIDRYQAADGYAGIIGTALRVTDAVADLAPPAVAAPARTLARLTGATELLAQEDALLAGALVAGEPVPGNGQALAGLITARTVLLPPALRPPADTPLAGLEAQALRWTTGAPPFSPDTWNLAAGADLTDLRAEAASRRAAVRGAVDRPVTGALLRLALVGGLGLLAVLAAVVLSVTTGRSLTRTLARLASAARESSRVRVPRVVERLRRGEDVDVEAEVPPLPYGDDELGQVGQAFNAVQETAVRAAIEQADLRRDVREVYLSLARRSQGLVHRQIGLLDTMERRTTDATGLADLFRVDHLATRMRRNAENLIVLSGGVAARGWRHAVPLVDVVRAGLAEVAEYTRVAVAPIEPAGLAGCAVGDAIHLLAELIENGVAFSPPYTSVRITGARVANGYAVEIEDRGLGMTGADLDSANARLAEPGEVSLRADARLGLQVVARLAERHSIRVRLRESPYGGTTAIVLLPAELIVDAQAAVPRPRTGEPVPERREPTAYTPAGLPARVRQASLPPAPRGAAGTRPEALPVRPPEEIRRLMAAYQSGTVQGRAVSEPESPLWTEGTGEGTGGTGSNG
jgi:signal transduction histidine kinase